MSKYIFVTKDKDKLKEKLKGLSVDSVFNKSLHAVEAVNKNTKFIVTDEPDDLLKSLDYPNAPKVISVQQAEIAMRVSKMLGGDDND